MNIKGDITGGIIAGIVALPLALAFGIASGLGASAGLWGAIALGFFASVFGGTKMQISGPTGPMSVVTASIVFHFGNDINSIMAIFVLTGILQIIFGVLKFGKFVKYIPYCVISGFMTGVGFIIILLQINPMLGVEGVGNTIAAIKSISSSFSNINLTALLVSCATVGILYLTPKKISKVIPSHLLAILLLTPLCVLMHANIPTIGEIPTGFPKFIVPNVNFAYLSSIIMYALMLALLGSIDSLLTSLVADSITKTKHKSNQELIGQGIGNALVGFVGGIPGAGATMRTVANIKAGGEGKISGVTHSVFLLLVVLIFAPVVSFVPLAVLSGILIKVGIDILDYRLLKRVFYIPKQDAIIMIIVFLLTVLVDLIFAVSIGVVLAWIFYMFNVSKRNKKFKIEIVDQDDTKTVKITGPMFFGTNSKILQNLVFENISKNLIIDCKNATFADISFVYSLEDFVKSIDETVIDIKIIIDEKMIFNKAFGELKYLLGSKVYLN